MAIGNDRGAGVGMSPEVFYGNLTNRQDADKGGTAHVISFAKSESEIIRRNTAEYAGFCLKKLPDYKKTPARAESYLTPGTVYRRAFAEKDKVEQLVQEYNTLFNDYNELLCDVKNRNDQLYSAVGKLNAFNESATKDIDFFDKKLMKQFELDARFDGLVEEFKKMRLISAEAAKKAETPVDLLQTLYRKHESEMKLHGEERKAHELISKTILEKYDQLKMHNKQYKALITETRVELDATKQALSQHQQQNLLDKIRLQKMTNAVKTKEQELSKKQALFVQKDGELKQKVKDVHNLTEDKKVLTAKLEQEKLDLAHTTRSSEKRIKELKSSLTSLSDRTEQLNEEKLQLEAELSQLKTNHEQLKDSENTNRELAQTVASSGSEIRRLEKILARRDQKILDLKKEKTMLSAEIQQKEHELSEEHSKQQEILQGYIDKLKTISDELSEKKEELQKSRDMFSKQLLSLKHDLDNKRNETLKLSKQVDADIKEMAKLKVHEKNLKSSLEAAKSTIDSFKTMVSNKNIEANEARKSHDSAVVRFQSKIEEQKAEIDNKEFELKKLSKQVAYLENEIKAHGNRTVGVADQIKEKEDKIIELKDDLQCTKKQLKEQEESLKSVNAELNSYKQKSSAVSKVLKNNTTKTDREISELKGALSELEKESLEKATEIEELRSQYDNAQEFVRTLQQKNGELLIELAKYTDRTEQNTQVVESNDQSQRLVERMQDEVAFLKEKLEVAYKCLQESGDSLQQDSLQQDRMQQGYQSMPSLNSTQSILREQNDELAAMYRQASEQITQLEEQVSGLEKANKTLLEKASIRDDEESDAEFELRQANNKIAQLNQEIEEMNRNHKQVISELDEKLSQESKKAAEANYKVLINANAASAARELESINEQLQKALTGLSDDLREVLSDEQFSELMQKHFGQTEQEAEVVEEHLPGYGKS